MKKCLSLVLVCLFANAGFAQSAFYVSAQGGPSKAYSTFRNRLTANYGLGIGYEFPNELIRVETGVARTNIFTIFNLDGYMGLNTEKENQVYLVRDSWQIPLRFKLKFWRPTDKVTLRAVTGVVLSLSPDDYELKGALINVNQNRGETIFQTNSSAQANTTYFFYGNSVGGVDSNWLIESGLEFSYKVSEKLQGNLGLVYQGGLQTKYGAVLFSERTDPDTGRSSYAPGITATSEANALNLSLGLTYALGK